MGMTGNPRVDEHIERLCSHGCRRVREYIRALEEGRDLPVFRDLNGEERRQLHAELTAIMAVYGSDCRL